MNLFDAHNNHLMNGRKIKASHWRKDSFLQERKIETYFCGQYGENTCIVDQDGRFVSHFYKDYWPREYYMYEWEVVE